MEYKCFLNKNENYNGRIQFLFGYKENGKKLELELRRDSIWLINYRTLTEEKFEKSNFEYENPTSEGNYMVSCIARLYIYISTKMLCLLMELLFRLLLKNTVCTVPASLSDKAYFWRDWSLHQFKFKNANIIL